jgi:alanine dehydrogenase
MLIGIPKEIKESEYRVALTPAGAEDLVQDGHSVVIESMAGAGSGFPDEEYENAGAKILATAKEVFDSAEMIMKVKEPLSEEIAMLQEGQTVFTYFHFAASEELTHGCLESKCVAVAYETVEPENGSLPLLTPMSEVAGRLAVQEGAKYLEGHYGGKGILLSGIPGVAPGKIVILGGGVVGTNAAWIAGGLGARVYILDIDIDRLRYLRDVLPSNVHPLFCNPYNIRTSISDADLVVGAVLLTGGKAPMLVTREMLSGMEPGSVIVDVAVDQGGCIETIKPTTHNNPTYEVDGIIHYGVANMPGAVPRTSTWGLTNATLPYARKLASLGWKEAARQDLALKRGVNMVEGKLTFQAVGEAFGLEVTPIDSLIAS